MPQQKNASPTAGFTPDKSVEADIETCMMPRMGVRPAAVLVPALALAFVSACKEDPKPAAMRPAAQGTTAQPATAASQPAAGDGTAQPAAAASQPAGGGAVAAGPPIAGQITIDPSVPKDALKESDVLFIMAREKPVGDVPGRLVAVQRQAPVKLPASFELGEKDLMVPGSAFTGPFILSARLDRDGDPMTKGPDDLYATYAGEVKSGQKGVELVLKRTPPPK